MKNSLIADGSLTARYAFIAAALAIPFMGIMYAAGLLGGRGVTVDNFIDLQQADTSYPGYRRAHAKGMCISGVFESNGALLAYSRASVFEQGSTAFIGRHSIAGNNPHANDLNAPVRSLALQLFLRDGQQWRIAMNTPPVMAVRTPEDFYQQLQALSPDPVTKQRDPQKIQAFFKAHPESQAFTHWNANHKASNSFATERYNSINAFYLVNAEGQKQAVRWVAVPQAVDSEEALDNSNADALQQEFAQRLTQQTVRFDVVFTLADIGDDENNPTVPWPNTRATVNAGTIIINAWQPQEGGACDGVNFDPLVLPQGIEATADPILRARSAAYAESYRRRAKETLIEQLQSAGAK